jgi:tellurite resistance protein TehA-like permease
MRKKVRSVVWLVSVIAIIALLVVTPVLAQSTPAPGPAPDAQPTWSSVFESVFTDAFIKQLITLLGLILLQVILAVADALKSKTFEWKKLADFYQVLVLPYILGWLALTFAVRIISADLLGTYAVIVGDGVPGLAWLVLVASLGARIVTTIKSLYGSLMPFTPPADKAS